MRVAVVALVVVVGCGGDPPVQPGPMPPTYAIAIPSADIVANGLFPVEVTVQGGANEVVAVTLDRATAGTLSVDALTLDASGTGTLEYRPCHYFAADCTGAATLQLATASDPDVIVATAALTLAKAAEVGDVGPCTTPGLMDNVFYIKGDDYIEPNTFTSPASAVWSWEVAPGHLTFGIPATGGSYRGAFSTIKLGKMLAAGVYDDAQRYGFGATGHPELDIGGPGRGCNQVSGRFQVHDYVADNATGELYEATVSFEQICDEMPGMSHGCFHFERPVPLTPPPHDPTKLSVQVFVAKPERPWDPNANAIFYNDAGDVVFDTQVNMFGQAEADVPSIGSVTVVQHDTVAGLISIQTYRGLTNGDHVEVNKGAPRSGSKSLMVMRMTPPANSTITTYTQCGVSGLDYLMGFPAASLDFYDACRTPTFDLLTVRNNTANVPQEYVWQTGLTHVPDGAFDFPADAVWTPMGTQNVALTNVPAGLSTINVHSALLIGGLPQELDGRLLTSPSTGTNSFSTVWPTGAGGGGQIDIEINAGIGTGYQRRRVVDTTSPATLTLDLNAVTVRTPSAVQQSATGLTWTQGTGSADVRTATWIGTLPNNTDVIWRVYETATSSPSVILPTLPVAYAAKDPTQVAGTTLVKAIIELVEYSTGGSVLGPPTGSYASHTRGAETP